MSPRRADEALSFTLLQRRLLLGLFGVVALCAAVRLFVDRGTVPDPQPPRGGRWSELADRLDPNTADWTELAALPGLGEKRAKAIVAKREAILAANPSAVPFARPQDLGKVSGIAYATTEQLKQYLRFPQETPATRPTPADGG